MKKLLDPNHEIQTYVVNRDQKNQLHGKPGAKQEYLFTTKEIEFEKD